MILTQAPPLNEPSFALFIRKRLKVKRLIARYILKSQIVHLYEFDDGHQYCYWFDDGHWTHTNGGRYFDERYII